MSDKRYNNVSDSGYRNIRTGTRGTDSRENIPAERVFLASCIRDASVFFNFSQYVTDKDFTIREHAQVFYIISEYYNGSGDDLSPIKFEAKANELGFSSLVGNQDVSQLFSINIDKDESEEAFVQLKRETIRRLYADVVMDVESYIDSTPDNAKDIVTEVEKRVIQVADTLRYGAYSIKSLTGEAWDIISKLADNPGNHGVDIGFPIWQKMVGEMSNGTVHMIIADTKTGKSQMGLRAGLYTAAKYNIPVLVCDSEMNQTQQTVRAMGMFLKVPYWILKTGYWKLSDEELVEKGVPSDSPDFFAVQQARFKLNDMENIKRFEKIPLYYLSINGLSVKESMPFVRQWLMRYTSIDKDNADPQAFLVYDYIKLAHAGELTSGLQEYQVLGLSAGELHNFAQKYHLPCLTFGQVNREIDRSIKCIAGSKRLVELVDSLSIMAKKSPEEIVNDPDGSRLISVEAVRDGSDTGRGYLSYEFDGDIGYMKELGYIGITNRTRDDEDSEG